MQFISVDFPTFGLPIILTKPDRCIVFLLKMRCKYNEVPAIPVIYIIGRLKGIFIPFINFASDKTL